MLGIGWRRDVVAKSLCYLNIEEAASCRVPCRRRADVRLECRNRPREAGGFHAVLSKEIRCVPDSAVVDRADLVQRQRVGVAVVIEADALGCRWRRLVAAASDRRHGERQRQQRKQSVRKPRNAGIIRGWVRHGLAFRRDRDRSLAGLRRAKAR